MAAAGDLRVQRRAIAVNGVNRLRRHACAQPGVTVQARHDVTLRIVRQGDVHARDKALVDHKFQQIGSRQQGTRLVQAFDGLCAESHPAQKLRVKTQFRRGQRHPGRQRAQQQGRRAQRARKESPRHCYRHGHS